MDAASASGMPPLASGPGTRSEQIDERDYLDIGRLHGAVHGPSTRQLINVLTYNLGFRFSRSENPTERADVCWSFAFVSRAGRHRRGTGRAPRTPARRSRRLMDTGLGRASSSTMV